MRTNRRQRRTRDWAIHCSHYTNIQSTFSCLVGDNLCQCLFSSLRVDYFVVTASNAERSQGYKAISVNQYVLFQCISIFLAKKKQLFQEVLYNTPWPCWYCPVTIRGKMWLRSQCISWTGCFAIFLPFLGHSRLHLLCTGALKWMHPDSSCTVTLFISQPKGRGPTRARTHALSSHEL